MKYTFEASWRAHGPALIIGLTLLLPACVASNDLKAPHSDSSFQSAHDLYSNGRYERATEAFTEILRTKAGRNDESLIARSYQYRGECRTGLKTFGLARFDYDMAVKVAKGSSGSFPDRLNLINECRIAKGDTYMYEGAFQSADRSFRKILDSSPPPEYRDGLYYRRYICAVKLGEDRPEEHLTRIQNERSFDKAYLAREFLDGGTRPPLRPDEKKEILRPPRKAVSTALLKRAEWNARPVKSNIDPMTAITKITVHHTAMYLDTTDRRATADEINKIQRNHQNLKNWADIGYHFIVDRAGRVWEGRPLRYQGAHAGNPKLNRGNIGVVLLGDFERQHPTAAQEQGLVRLLNTLCKSYGLSRSRQVTTHLEITHGGTLCPGKHLQAFMNQWRISG